MGSGRAGTAGPYCTRHGLVGYGLRGNLPGSPSWAVGSPASRLRWRWPSAA